MASYTVKQVGNPLDMKGKREIVVYNIYKGSKKVGEAIYDPRIYKSKYLINMFPKTYPKEIRDSIIARDGARELNFPASAGTSAKNPTAVLKQFKQRYEGTISARLSRIREYKKSQAKTKRAIKKSGLSAKDYEQLGKYKVYIANNKADIKARLRNIKSEKELILIHRANIKRWEKKIAELRKK